MACGRKFTSSASTVWIGVSGGGTWEVRSERHWPRRCFELGWIERVKGSRAVTITASGRNGLLATFSIAI